MHKDASPMCVRSLLYQHINDDRRIASRTSFFGAASVVTSALASTSQSNFMDSLSEKLENLNIARARQISDGRLYGKGSVEQNTADFIHFEQSIVQGELDALREANPQAHAEQIQEANDALNGSFNTVAGRMADPTMTAGLAAAKKLLGRPIDVARQSDRETLGRAMAKEVMMNRNFCTGSRIRRC